MYAFFIVLLFCDCKSPGDNSDSVTKVTQNEGITINQVKTDVNWNAIGRKLDLSKKYLKKSKKIHSKYISEIEKLKLAKKWTGTANKSMRKEVLKKRDREFLSVMSANKLAKLNRILYGN